MALHGLRRAEALHPWRGEGGVGREGGAAAGSWRASSGRRRVSYVTERKTSVSFVSVQVDESIDEIRQKGNTVIKEKYTYLRTQI